MLQPDLSIIILCYKAKDELKSYTDHIFREMGEYRNDFEFILVCNYDKGDAENNVTFTVAQEIQQKYPFTKISFLEKEGGMGWDLISGLHICSGKYTCYIDGDGQTHPSDIIKLYDIIRNQDFDLVKTYRKERRDGIFRIVQSVVFNVFFNLLYVKGTRYKDVNAKPKMALTQTFRDLQLNSKDWFIDAEIMYKLHQKNARILEIPTIFYENEHRSSFVNWKTIFEFLGNMLQYFMKGKKY